MICNSYLEALHYYFDYFIVYYKSNIRWYLFCNNLNVICILSAIEDIFLQAKISQAFYFQPFKWREKEEVDAPCHCRLVSKSYTLEIRLRASNTYILGISGLRIFRRKRYSLENAKHMHAASLALCPTLLLGTRQPGVDKADLEQQLCGKGHCAGNSVLLDSVFALFFLVPP